MPTKMSSILRAATRKPDEKLKILTFPTHERYESMLAKTGHAFYSYRAEGIKDWNETYAKLPDNYILLDPALGEAQIPDYVDFDLVLSQNKFGQFQIAKELAAKFHLPLVSLEHTLPMPQWGEDILLQTRQMRGHVNVFISDYSIDNWGWESQEDTEVITHGIDTELFCPSETNRGDEILSVVNDWINRDWCCGFKLWQEVIKGLPHKVVGDTPGLSEPASSTKELVAAYQNSKIFLNTSTISPVPTVLMEAMSCGCAIVSTATCMIPEIIENGVNGFISNDPEELKHYLVDLLNDENLAKEIGKNARKTITEKHSASKFVNRWNEVLESSSKVVFRG
jgi:glycosyltransferase involved in cell wall biosynthesis